jgi:hypothetical protein
LPIMQVGIATGDSDGNWSGTATINVGGATMVVDSGRRSPRLREACQIEMSGFECRNGGAGLCWIRCFGEVALPGADPKTATTGLAPKQMAPYPQSNRAISCR